MLVVDADNRVDDLTIERELRAVWPAGAPLPPLARALLDDLLAPDDTVRA